jgi:biotin transport system substrate-specific component
METAGIMIPKNNLRMTVYASLLAALIAAGAYIAVPIGPVPIVLQNLFIFLAGLLLGPSWGTASVGIYLFAGACGFPVFAGGTGGIGRFIGPTGGYLIGFLPAVYIIGVMSNRKHPKIFWDVFGMITGSLIIYVFGLPWLKYITGLSWQKAIAVGVFPFLIGDALKIAAAVPIVKMLRPMIREKAGF